MACMHPKRLSLARKYCAYRWAAWPKNSARDALPCDATRVISQMAASSTLCGAPAPTVVASRALTRCVLVCMPTGVPSGSLRIAIHMLRIVRQRRNSHYPTNLAAAVAIRTTVHFQSQTATPTASRPRPKSCHRSPPSPPLRLAATPPYKSAARPEPMSCHICTQYVKE